MFDRLFEIIAPHHCISCAKTGTLLCVDCKYNITLEPFEACLGCALPTAGRGVCRDCQLPFSRAWVVGERSGAIEELVNTLKFQRSKDAGRVLAGLLDDVVSQLPADTVVVAIPTISSHIRQRGYDHAKLIAKNFAQSRNLRTDDALKRATNTTQRGKKSRERRQQASRAFKISGEITPNVPYLLIDDVITTGATVEHAAKVLKQSGVQEVWVAAIARNPLD